MNHARRGARRGDAISSASEALRDGREDEHGGEEELGEGGSAGGRMELCNVCIVSSSRERAQRDGIKGMRRDQSGVRTRSAGALTGTRDELMDARRTAWVRAQARARWATRLRIISSELGDERRTSKGGSCAGVARKGQCASFPPCLSLLDAQRVAGNDAAGANPGWVCCEHLDERI